MTNHITEIRPITSKDLDGIKSILNETELFPADMLEQMITPFLTDSECSDIWTVCVHDNQIAGFLYCEQERMTEATWNVLAIAVLPQLQHNGFGKTLMADVENTLINNHQNILIVETSGLPEYQNTQQFYLAINYTKEAVVRDFYAKGDDKVIFWKSLT